MAQIQDLPEHNGRRRSARIKAWLHVSGERFCIEITDYSRHRLEVGQVRAIRPDQRVTVELSSGTRLPVVVEWVEGSSASLCFVGPIAPGHPVMRELIEAEHKPRRSGGSIHADEHAGLDRACPSHPPRNYSGRAVTEHRSHDWWL